MTARTDDETTAAALAALPAQIDGVADLVATVERRVALVERGEASYLGSECGVAVNGLREAALALARVRSTADVVAAGIALGYDLRCREEQAEAEAEAARRRLRPVAS